MVSLALSPGRAQAPVPPLAACFRHGGGERVALSEGPSGGLHVWSEVGGGAVARLRFDGDDPTCRYSWRELRVGRLRNVYPVAEFSTSGSWSQLQTSGSGLSGSYTGNRCLSTSSQGAEITVALDRAEVYDVWVHYTGRLAGAYCAVLIDGAETLVDALDDPGIGVRAFSTYSETDLSRRRTMRVASGLSGAHTLTLRHAGAAQPGGSTLMIEAVSITGRLGDPRVLPPLWQPGTAYVMGDEVQWKGTYYAARATGVSGAVPPSHLSGIASDGTLDWRADYATTYADLAVQDYASEREYAVRLDLDGGREIGGQTHGGEVLQARAVMLDGTPVGELASGMVVGTDLRIDETCEWQDGAGAPIAECRLSRRITAGLIGHEVSLVTGTVPLEVEWLYLAMQPGLHRDGETGGTVVDRWLLDGGEVVDPAGHSGQAGGEIARAGLRRVGAEGDALRLGLDLATPPGGTPVAVTARLFPNVEGAATGGGEAWPVKAYLAATPPAGRFEAGAHLRWVTRHFLAAGQ